MIVYLKMSKRSAVALGSLHFELVLLLHLGVVGDHHGKDGDDDDEDDDDEDDDDEDDDDSL